MKHKTYLQVVGIITKYDVKLTVKKGYDFFFFFLPFIYPTTNVDYDFIPRVENIDIEKAEQVAQKIATKHYKRLIKSFKRDIKPDTMMP